MAFFVVLISGIIIILGIIIGAQNANTLVTFHLLKWSYTDIPLTVLLIESVLFGMVIATIIAGINQIKSKLQMRKVYREKKDLEEEVKALKSMPFEEEEEI